MIEAWRIKEGFVRWRVAAAVLVCVIVCPRLMSSVSGAEPAPEWNAAAETLVLYNPLFEGSEALARYYAERRGIPPDRILGLPCSVQETVSRDEFEDTIKGPLLKEIIERKWWEIEMRDLLDPKLKKGA